MNKVKRITATYPKVLDGCFDITDGIVVWDFSKAPEDLRKLMTGDDADWLALVPESMMDRYIGWMEMPHFGCCSVEKQKVEVEGELFQIVVGYHA